MPSRNFPDWLMAYTQFAAFGEAPKYMHFWAGVSAVAGALRRKVWVDQKTFTWFPNFYIIFVAPPGVVTKSTTAGLALSILREVPGINFGPDVVTWPALVECFCDATESFQYGDTFHTMSSMTLESSEFGNLFDPRDRNMVDLFVNLWDGKQGDFRKVTKGSGQDTIENPWINLIACTTPSWIAENFSKYMIGGGFCSRCVFVYADKKEKFIAYPKRNMEAANFPFESHRKKLLEDLKQIAAMKGEFTLTEAAYEWGEQWYSAHYNSTPLHLQDEQFSGYIARKQSHLHKLAMVLSASTSSSLIIEKEHLQIADEMVTDLEQDMAKVFAKIGRSEKALDVEKLLSFVRIRKKVLYEELCHYVHLSFPSARDWEDILAGCINAGKIDLKKENGKTYILWK